MTNLTIGESGEPGSITMLEIYAKIVAMSALSFCLPSMAQEHKGWQFDSLRVNSSVSKSDAQRVYEVLLKMLDRWNAHDIEDHLEAYWKSPELLMLPLINVYSYRGGPVFLVVLPDPACALTRTLDRRLIRLI